MKQIFILLASALLLVACHSDHDDETQPLEGEGRISFQVINYQQYSLDDVTRASVSSLTQLDMVIYEATTDTLVKHEHKGVGEEGYGSFSATLPYGSYHVVMLGYDGTIHSAIVDNIEAICFPDDYVPHFFSKTLDIVVDKPVMGAQNISLTRRVAAFMLCSSGSNPSDLKSLTIEAQGGSHHFNALTDRGVQVEPRSYTFNVANKAGANSFEVTTFSFLTAEEANMNFTATARNAAGKELRRREFTNVPMRISQRTQYNGYFFDDDKGSAGFSLSLEDTPMSNDLHTY